MRTPGDQDSDLPLAQRLDEANQPIPVEWRALGKRVALICLGVLLAFTILDRIFGLGVAPLPGERRLGRAAAAILPGDEDGTPPMVRIITPEGTQVTAPAGPHFDRREAIILTVQLEQMRQECERRIFRLLANVTEDAVSGRAGDTADIIGLWHSARARLDAFLVLEPGSDGIVLAALGWPWLGDGGRELFVPDLRPSFPGRPAAFRALPVEAWEDLLVSADQDEPWIQTRSRIVSRFQLNDHRLNSLRAHLCRRDLEAAFDSSPARRKAARTLARLNDLTPAQIRSLLAMAGAGQLLRAGKGAFPPLIDVLAIRPDLALPLLRECVESTGVMARTQWAIVQFEAGHCAQAQRELLALGPFALQALQAHEDKGGGQRQGLSEVRQLLEGRWPGKGEPVDVLGSDADRWRRWYRQAHDLL